MMHPLVLIPLMACMNDANLFKRLPERKKNQLVAIHLMKLDKTNNPVGYETHLINKLKPKKPFKIHEFRVVLGSKFMLVVNK